MKFNKILKSAIFAFSLIITGHSIAMDKDAIKTGAKELLGADNIAKILVKLSNGTLKASDLLNSLKLDKLADKTGLDAEFVQDLVRAINHQYFMQKSWLTQKLELLPPQVLDQLKGALFGIGTVTTSWLLGHACCHSAMEFFEPQQFLTAAPLALLTTFGLYKVLQSLRARNSSHNLILNVALPLTTFAASQAYSALTADTSDTKDEDSKDEDALDKIKIQAKKKKSLGKSHPLFDDFANTLTEEQLQKLPNPNILMLAQFNPSLLLSQTEFVKSLDGTQAEQLQNMIEKKSKSE